MWRKLFTLLSRKYLISFTSNDISSFVSRTCVTFITLSVFKLSVEAHTFFLSSHPTIQQYKSGSFSCKQFYANNCEFSFLYPQKYIQMNTSAHHRKLPIWFVLFNGRLISCRKSRKFKRLYMSSEFFFLLLQTC